MAELALMSTGRSLRNGEPMSFAIVYWVSHLRFGYEQLGIQGLRS